MIATCRTLSVCLLIATLSYAAFSRSGIAQPEKLSSATPTGANKQTATKPAVADASLPVVEDDKFTIEVTSKKDKFYSGEPIDIDITFKNNGATKTKMTVDRVEEFFDIEVTGPYRGVPPFLPSVAQRRYDGSLDIVDFEPTDTLSGIVRLSSLYDLSLGGPYTVRVAKRFRFRDAKKGPVVILSNTLKIEVAHDTFLSEWHGASENR